LNTEVEKNAKILWDYHNVTTALPSTVDFVLAMGSHDDRVAHHAAQLMLDGRAPRLITSGGFGKVTAGTNSEPEGERFKQIAVADGVRPESIVVEAAAANTGDNITLTRSLLEKQGLSCQTSILVTKPYMKRRALATATKQWPDVTWWASAPDISFESYPTDEVPERRMIELMVGDLQRIDVYAEQGFQSPQQIPVEVWECYHNLVTLGYDKYVIRERA
jgi:uncharacterized SAM-binding protein YcdF (DUF218 family)